MSFEKYIMDIEIVSMVKKCTEELDMSDMSLAVDVIKEVGSAGEFLTNRHTFDNFKSSVYIPDLSVRGYTTGNEAEAIYKQKIDIKMNKMLEKYEKPYLDKKIKEQLKSYLGNNGFDLKILN